MAQLCRNIVIVYVYVYAAHFMQNSISGLTPFTYFRISVSLEVMVGMSSDQFEVSNGAIRISLATLCDDVRHNAA